MLSHIKLPFIALIATAFCYFGVWLVFHLNDRNIARDRDFYIYSEKINSLYYEDNLTRKEEIKHALKQMDKEYPDFYQKYLEKKKVEERWE